MSRAEIFQKLEQIHIFEKLCSSSEDADRLINIIRRVKYQKNRIVIHEGELGNDMFIVYSGSVQIRKRTRAGDSYTVVNLSADQNVFFGELALIDDDKRSATVRTLSDCEFLVLDKADFIKLGNDYPHIALPITRAISQILAGRLRRTTADMLTIFDALVNELSG